MAAMGSADRVGRWCRRLFTTVVLGNKFRAVGCMHQAGCMSGQYLLRPEECRNRDKRDSKGGATAEPTDHIVRAYSFN
jgi:hypothetical protein